jgi:gas vesicle structural protein
MAVERGGGTSLVDVLDRVLDKGIVIDAMVNISLVGFEIIRVEARVIVASINTFLDYAAVMGQLPAASRPLLETGAATVPAGFLAATAARRPSAAGRVASR